MLGLTISKLLSSPISQKEVLNGFENLKTNLKQFKLFTL